MRKRAEAISGTGMPWPGQAVLVSIACAALALTGRAQAASSRDEVLVVYNKNLRDSRSVAEHYAERRQIPTDRLVGLELPQSETMTRAEYEERLALPLLRKLRDSRLWIYPSGSKRRGSDNPELPIEAKIRYAALCYGVPLKILSDPKINEEGTDKLRPELRRNDAAVDSELALLPSFSRKSHLSGAIPNRFYGATNALSIHPTNGILIVARLDGPSVEIARGLIDKAIQAEADGLWGRAYFDARGLTNTNYKLGDDWMRGCAQVATRLGFETILDQDPATFPSSFPLSHVALYAGWYDGSVSGPFTRPTVEFMPGAFAYHLHSYSAQTIRSTTANWVGPLLAKGVTATLGCVEEPYLEATPDVMAFLIRFLYFGFSFGEAAYACQNSLSWQTTVVGDPLYRPFAKPALERHDDLLRRKSKLIEWSHLRVVNLSLANAVPVEKLIEYLEKLPEAQTSAVLLEKLADLYFLKARWTESVPKYRAALAQNPSRQQQVRLALALGRALEFSGQPAEATHTYLEFLKQVPDYPDPVSIYRKLVALCDQLGTTQEKVEYQRQIDRLTPPAISPKS